MDGISSLEEAIKLIKSALEDKKRAVNMPMKTQLTHLDKILFEKLEEYFDCQQKFFSKTYDKCAKVHNSEPTISIVPKDGKYYFQICGYLSFDDKCEDIKK